MTDPLLLVDEHGELVAPGCPQCREYSAKQAGLQGDLEALMKELAAVVRQRDALKQDKEAKMRADKQYPAAEALFQKWQERCGHPNSPFGPDRVRLALAAVRLYKNQPEKLDMAIEGARECAFVDSTGRRHDSFGLVFRGTEKIEDFALRFYYWRRAQA